MSEKPTDLNNTPNVTEKSVAPAPKPHQRGSWHNARGIVQEWWWLRLSAAALVPLSIWFLAALVENLLGGDRSMVAAWLNHKGVAIALGLMLVLSFIHTRLGLHEIIIDYVHKPCCKRAVTLFVDLLTLALTFGSLAAIYHLHKMA